MSELIVTLAAPPHQPFITACNQRMARDTEGRELDSETLARGVAAVFEDERRGFYVVASLSGAPVGCLMVTYEWSDWRAGEFWWIQSVFVAPQARKQGVYRAMYAYVRERATARGNVCGFRLYVERDNLRAQRTYTALGMQPTPYLLFETEPEA